VSRPEAARAATALNAVNGPREYAGFGNPRYLDALSSPRPQAQAPVAPERHVQSSEPLFLGVDIGSRGAIGLITQRLELVDVFDMPCLNDGPKGRRSVNAALLAELIGRTRASIAYVEWVGPRPTDGAVQAFAFGRCKGVLEGFWPPPASL
jgi:hypothetical protein